MEESDKGRQTIFFTPLDPFGGDCNEEEPSDDYTIPQKVHYHSHWTRNQDALYCLKSLRSTRSRIAILANKVSCDLRTRSCASRVHLQNNLSERRSNTVRQTLNATTRGKNHTEKQLAIAAATAAAVYLW